MSKFYRILLPLEVSGEFPDDEPLEVVKESLGEQLDSLLLSTDDMWDYWKEAQVEEIEGWDS